MEKCFEKLYDSLEQDISLMCNLLNKERNDTIKDERTSSCSVPRTNGDCKTTTNIENTDDTNINIINNLNLNKILDRIEMVIKIITNLNYLEQGTSYLGSG
jgi:hypothetical protein